MIKSNEIILDKTDYITSSVIANILDKDWGWITHWSIPSIAIAIDKNMSTEIHMNIETSDIMRALKRLEKMNLLSLEYSDSNVMFMTKV